MDEFLKCLQHCPDRWPVGQRYLVGVSGGVDSVALLRGLVGVGYRKLVVCHLNHRLRGRVSAGDAAFVKRLAVELGLEFESGVHDVVRLAKENGQSLETAGRAARHAFFAEVAGRRRCRRMMLAHHADDQAETVLMNLCRGSAGLAGMAAETVLNLPEPVPGGGSRTRGRLPLLLIRPLLAVPKKTLLAAATARGWKFREDASNASADFVRNRVRNEVLPLLEEIFRRDVRPALGRAADWAAGARAFLRDSAAPWTVQEKLPVREVLALSPALRREVLAGWLKARGVPDLSASVVQTAESMLNPADGPVKWNLPGNRFLRRRAGWLWVECVPACGAGPG